jgi:hypothetical protein
MVIIPGGHRQLCGHPRPRPRLPRPGRPPSVVRPHGSVVHIGFLSTKKIPSPDRKMRASKKCHGLSVSFCCCTFCSVTPTYRHAQAPGSLLLSCEVPCRSLFESARRRQASLSCSHPSGSRPWPFLPIAESPGPIPTSSGPEQRQYRTRFKGGSLPGERPDIHQDWPCRTEPSTLRDSGHGRKRFPRI